jgi:hypothetical protein
LASANDLSAADTLTLTKDKATAINIAMLLRIEKRMVTPPKWIDIVRIIIFYLATELVAW